MKNNVSSGITLRLPRLELAATHRVRQPRPRSRTQTPQAVLLLASLLSLAASAFSASAQSVTITQQPASVTNYVSLNASFSVGASGTAPLSYQWNKGGVPIAGATADNYTITGLAFSDAGNYSVTITNVVGASNSAIATLTVLPPPSSPPAIAGLVVHLPFDNNLSDATGRGNNGTCMLTTSSSTNPATPTFVPVGVLGQALHYSTEAINTGGTNSVSTNASYVTLGVRPDLQFSSNVSFSVSFWIRLPANYDGGDLPFFTDSVGSLGHQGFVFSPAYGFGTANPNPNPSPQNDGGWATSLYDGAGNGVRLYGDLGSINDGGWHHLVYVFDRIAGSTIYLDGVPANSSLISGTSSAAAGNIDATPANPATIGQDPTGSYGETGSGDIDDLGVWRKALTPLEVASIYMAAVSNQLSFVGAPLLSYTLNIPSGLSFIANQLDHGSNTADIVFSNSGQLDGDQILKWNCGSSNVFTFDSTSPTGFSDGIGNPLPAPSVAPGEGFGFNNLSGTLSLTFTGTPHVPVLPETLACGYGNLNLLSRQTNDVGTYANIIGLAPQNGAQEQIWNGASFAVYTFTNGAWSPTNPPSLNVGQSALFLVPQPPPSYALNLQTGYNLIANQLDHGSNTLNEVLPGVPNGCAFFKYNNAGSNWSAAIYSSSLGRWTPANLLLNPGEGGFLQSPTNFSITFTGTPHVPVLPVTIPNGACYLLSRQTNDVGNWTNIVGLVPPVGAKVFNFITAAQSYSTSVRVSFGSGWSPSAPTAAVGEAVWVAPAGGSPAPLPVSYNLNIHSGYNLIANQLDHGSNTLNEVLPGVPDGCVLSKFNNASATWSTATYSAAQNSWTPTNFTLIPGEGAFLQSPTNFSIVFTGTPHVPVLPVVNLGSSAAYLLSRQTNDVGTYTNILGYAPTNGAKLYRWAGSGYTTYTFSSGAWAPASPTAAVGEAVWISPAGGVPPSPFLQTNTLNIPNDGSYVLIANQLDHGSNTLDEVLPNVPDQTVLQKWNCSIHDLSATQYIFTAFSHHWSPSGGTLAPGDGAFIVLPGLGPNPYPLTFTGQPHVPILPVTLPCGYGSGAVLSRQTNDVGNFTNITGLLPQEGSMILRWNVLVQDFDPYTFSSGAWWPSSPTMNVGEAVLVSTGGSSNSPCISLQSPGNIVAQGCTNAAVSYNASATDTCYNNNSTAITFYPSSGAVFQPGTNPVLCVAREFGHAASRVFTVAVQANPSLTLTCATNKTVGRGTSWDFDTPVASDPCCTNVSLTVVGTVTNGTCSRFLTRTWLATDTCGRSNTCSQTVTLSPGVLSVFAFCGDTRLTLAFGEPLSPASALNPTNYQIQCGGASVPLAGISLTADGRLVVLTSSQPLGGGTNCLLAINGVQGVCGDSLDNYQTNLSCTAAPCAYSSAGAEFWLTFPGNYAPNPATPPLPQLFIAGIPGTLGTVSMPGLAAPFNASFTIPGTGVAIVTLPAAADLGNANDIVQTNGVHVLASQPVTVYGLDHVPYTTDGYLGIPARALGKSYLVLGYRNVFTGVPKLNGSQFAIAAAQDNTTVTIIPSDTVGLRTATTPFSVTLMQGQTYQLRDTNSFPGDLTGTSILADQPIAVFGSHQAAAIPNSNYFFLDYLVEQLPPTQVWGTNFVTVPLATRLKGDTFRFLALADGTTVRTNGTALPAVVNKAAFAEVQLATASQITSDKPILVAQYADSSDFDQVDNSDPLMVLIPPTSLYASSYVVQTPTNGFTGNYLNVMVPAAAKSAVKLDNGMVAASQFSQISSSGFWGAQLPVATTAHTIFTTNGLPFGLIVYGWSLYDAYGYPGGTCGPLNVPAVNFTCPPTNIVIQAGAGCMAPLPNLTTNVGNASSAFYISQSPAAGTLVGLGSHTVTVSIWDQSGGSQTCTSSITVTPGNTAGLQCPSDIVTNCSDLNGRVVFYQVGLCNTNFILHSTPASGSVFSPGTNTVTCVATNNAGARETCSFKVTVNCLAIVPVYPVYPGGSLILNWPGSAVLQRADSPVGPWVALTNVASPYTVPLTGTQGFFRVQQ